MFSTKRRLMLFASVAAFGLLLAVVSTMFKATPLLASEGDLVNPGGDMAVRLENSPFGAFPMLFNALEDGIVSVSYEFTDRWTSGSFDFEIHSDEPNRQYKLLMDFDVNGTQFDLTIYIDRYLIAVSSSILGEEFYGLTFATFRDDFRLIAQLLGIGEDDIDQIAAIIDIVGDTMNTPDVGPDVWDPYAALFRQFLLSGTASSENTTIQETNVTRVEFRFSDDDMVSLFRDILVTMSEDQNMDPMGIIAPWMWEETIRDFESSIAELDAMDGNLHIVMYVGPQNRLVQLEVNVSLTGNGSSTDLRFTADFGTSVFDPWHFTYIVNAEFPSWVDASQTDTLLTETVYVWTFTENEGRFVNSIDISSSLESNRWDSLSEEVESFTVNGSIRMVSDWNSITGEFVLALESDQSDDPSEISGIFIPDSNGGFLLRFEDNDTFSLEISAQIGANIQPIQNFINFNDIPLGTLIQLMMQL